MNKQNDFKKLILGDNKLFGYSSAYSIDRNAISTGNDELLLT